MNDMSPASAPAAVTEADRLGIILGVLLAMLLAALDQTIVAPAIPAMGAALGGTNYLSWIVSAYFLTATATTPLYGKLADIHGRRPVLFAAIAVFVAGSIVCALSASMVMLILGRAIQGLGGGGLIALAQTVIGDLVAPRERGKFAVYISGTWAIASVAGPVVGGFITQHLHWSLIFWLNLPLAALAVAMTNSSLKKLPWQKRDYRLDLLGAVLVVVATTAFMLALALGPQRQFGWTSPAVLGLFGTALVLAMVIAGHLQRAAEPLIPLAVLQNRVVLTATVSVFFSMAAFVGLSVFVPLFLELALGLDASQAGLALVGYMVGTVLGANFAGQTMARVTHYKRLPLAGLTVGAAGLLWLSFRAGHMGLWEAEIFLIIVGTGSGLQFPVTVVAVQNAVDQRDIGVATGVLAFLRALGSSIGVAVMGAVGSASGVVIGMADAAQPGTGGSVLLPLMPGEVFAPVFFAAACSLILGLLTLTLMPELALRGQAAAATAAKMEA